ncbi:MAG: DsbA family protein [Candidatus Eisenbacteria bacterium]
MNPTPTGGFLVPPVGPRDHAQGPANAPVTLVEYCDYECSHCGRAHPIIKAVRKHFGERLRFVFRNFPRSEVHPHAVKAAEAAEAASDFGMFWEMHDAIFEHQDALALSDLIAHADAIGIKSGRIAESLEMHAQAGRVRGDYMSGVKSGVSVTPAFFLNGARYEGPWDEAGLIAAIEAAGAAAAVRPRN